MCNATYPHGYKGLYELLFFKIILEGFLRLSGITECDFYASMNLILLLPYSNAT